MVESMASSKALDLLHWAMCAIMYQSVPMAIGMASKVGLFFHLCVFAVALAATGAIRSK
jgi:hypothetical protein